MEQRLKGLNTTGVAGDFTPIVIFPSDRPKQDEKKIHDKLAKKRLAKEHFDLKPIEAALNPLKSKSDQMESLISCGRKPLSDFAIS